MNDAEKNEETPMIDEKASQHDQHKNNGSGGSGLKNFFIKCHLQINKKLRVKERGLSIILEQNQDNKF